MGGALCTAKRASCYGICQASPKMQQDNKNLTVVQGEITDQEKVADALVGQDAVIWCAGIPMKWKYPEMQSLEGHKILIQAMQERGVKRLIDWGTSSIHSARDKNHL